MLKNVKEIVPELVSIEDNSNSMGDGIKDVHTMKYQNTVGLLIEAIKDLKGKIEELKQTNDFTFIWDLKILLSEKFGGSGSTLNI